MSAFRTIALFGLLTVPTLVATAPAAAEEAEAFPDEIVVTAQKRSERLQDVPLSLSVLSGESVAAKRLSQADDIAAKVPNLQFSATVGENTPIFALRGVSMSDFSLNQDGPVATYYDEVYKGNFAFLGIQLYDLERIEVLRGPQGTLYGKNTTGGAINLISARPVMRNEGYAQVGLGNYARREANGAANLVLADGLAARIAFTAARADGWFRNRLPGKPDLSGTREYGVRGSLLWEAAPGAKLTLRLSTSLQNPTNYGNYSKPVPAGVGNGVYESFGQGSSYFRNGLKIREIEAEYVLRRHARTWSASLAGEFDVADGLSVTSITAWDRGSLFVPEDTDGSPTRALEIPYTARGKQFSQDLRLTSDWSDGFNFILGAYFHRESLFNSTEMNFWTDLDANADGALDSADCAAAFFYSCIIGNRFDQLKHSYALYSDLRYALPGGFTLRGGLRFTRDDGNQKNLVADARGIDGVVVTTLIPSTNRSFRKSNVSGKIGLDWKGPDNTLLFASYSRGYRGNGFNAQAYFDVSEANVAKPETIDAFEAGVKAEPFGRVFSVGLTGFHYIYRNQQFLSVNPANAAQTLVNLDRSRIYGAEIEADARPLPTLDLHFAMGLLHARAQKGVISGVDVSGHHLSNAPSLNLSSAFDWRVIDNGADRVSLRGDLSYVSSQYFEVMNIQRLHQQGYALLGGSVEYARGPWTVSLWGKNLTDKIYFTSRIDLSGFGFDYNHVGTPRTFGGTVKVKF